jgi:hypothetical protein
MPSTSTLRRRAAVATADPFGGVLSRTMLRRMGVDRHAVAREIAGDRWRAHGDQTIALHTQDLGVPALWWRALWEVGCQTAARDGASALEARRRDRLRLQRRARLRTRCVQPQAGLGRSAAPRGPARGRGDTQPRSTACRSGARGRACRALGVLRPAGRAPPRPAHPARCDVGSAAGLGEPGSPWPPTPSTDPPAGRRHHRRGPIVGRAGLRGHVPTARSSRAGPSGSTPDGARERLPRRRVAWGSPRGGDGWQSAHCGLGVGRRPLAAERSHAAKGLRFAHLTARTSSVGRRLPRPDRPRSVRAEMVVIPTVWARNRN